ncbi:hypothetical protein ACRHK7_06445 [Weissella tructae]|nr:MULTISPECIES: bacteriocin-associated integral membrane protein [Weissella]ELA07028.1 bacteriocin-associated integral membrane protein [Weissella ceti NC36]QVV91885.1 hypothetical protein KHQ32_03135 [Weissella tructae]
MFKIRKVLLVLIGGLFVLGSYLLFQASHIHYLSERATKQARINADFMPFTLPNDIKSDKEYTEILDLLQETSTEQDLNYVKVQRYGGFQLNEYQEIDYGTTEDRLTYQVATVKPSKVWTYFDQPEANVEREYRDDLPLKGYSATIEPMSANVSYTGRQGVFYVETTNEEQFQQFIHGLASKYNQHFKTQYGVPAFTYSEDDLEYLQDTTVETNEAHQYTGIASILFGILLIFVVLYILLSTKYIGTYRLAGFSSYQMFYQLFQTTFRRVLLCTVLLGIVLRVFGHLVISVKTILLLISIIGLMVIVGTGVIALLNRFSLSKQLKNKSYLNWSFYLVYIVKGIALVMLFSMLVPMFQYVSLKAELMTSSGYKDAKIGAEYGVLTPRIVGYEMTNLDIDKHDETKARVYQKLNDKGALLFDQGYREGTNRNNVANVEEVFVNPNYLQKFPLKDMADNSVVVSDTSTQVTLLVPKNRADELEDSVGDDGITERRIVLMPENATYFDLNRGEYQPMPIVSVVTENNGLLLNILTGDIYDGLKIPLTGTAKDTYHAIYDDLAIGNYADKFVQIVSLNDLALDELKAAIGNLKNALVTNGIMFIFILMMNVYVIVLYYRSHNKELYYKYMAGYSEVRLFAKLFVLIAMQYVVMFGVLLTQSAFDLTLLVGMTILCLFELLTVFVVGKIIKRHLLGEKI